MRLETDRHRDTEDMEWVSGLVSLQMDLFRNFVINDDKNDKKTDVVEWRKKLL